MREIVPRPWGIVALLLAHRPEWSRVTGRAAVSLLRASCSEACQTLVPLIGCSLISADRNATKGIEPRPGERQRQRSRQTPAIPPGFPAIRARQAPIVA